MIGEISPSSLLGGLFIEVCLALMCVLYGIVTAQAYVYMLNSKNDSTLIKITVGGVWILETVHSIFIIHMVYHYTIHSFGDIRSIGEIVWSTGASVLIEMAIVSFVQGFYVRRVFILSRRSKVLTILTGGLLLFVLYSGLVRFSMPNYLIQVLTGYHLVTAILTYFLDTWTTFRGSKGPLFTLIFGLALSAAVDLAIAVILIYYLDRSQTGYKSTDGVIRFLMAYAVNTGAVTMIVSLCIVLTFIFLKNSLIFVGFVTVASKLYANSFFGTLNTRKMFRERIPMASTYNSVTELARFSRHANRMGSGQQPIQIYQETTKVIDI